MKAEGQYKLFCGCNYNPDGGYIDFKGNFTSCEEAIQSLKCRYDWAHIVQNDKIIMSGINNDSVYPNKWEWREEE